MGAWITRQEEEGGRGSRELKGKGMERERETDEKRLVWLSLTSVGSWDEKYL